MYRLLILISALLIGTEAMTQKELGKSEEAYFGNIIRIGASVTYIWEENEWAENHFFGETTWNLNAAFRMSKRFWIGAQAAPIFTRDRVGPNIKRKTYYMAGIFGQFDFYNSEGFRFYGETSINLSDYCTCGNVEPNRLPNLFKWGGGAGLEVLLNKGSGKNLWLELAFFNYVILNEIQNKYNYTQYIIGLNYTFGKLN